MQPLLASTSLSSVCSFAAPPRVQLRHVGALVTYLVHDPEGTQIANVLGVTSMLSAPPTCICSCLPGSSTNPFFSGFSVGTPDFQSAPLLFSHAFHLLSLTGGRVGVILKSMAKASFALASSSPTRSFSNAADGLPRKMQVSLESLAVCLPESFNQGVAECAMSKRALR